MQLILGDLFKVSEHAAETAEQATHGVISSVRDSRLLHQFYDQMQEAAKGKTLPSPPLEYIVVGTRET